MWKPVQPIRTQTTAPVSCSSCSSWFNPEPICVQPSSLIARASTDVYAVDDPITAKALRFISEHSARPIGVTDVVASVPVTRRSLERRFRLVLGRSIHEELTRSRMTRLKRLLVEKADPIKALAADTGFSSSEHLSKVFRRYEGTSPGAYRKEHRRVGGASSMGVSPMHMAGTAMPRPGCPQR